MTKLKTYFVDPLQCHTITTDIKHVEVIRVQDLLDHIEQSAEKGNMKPDNGFSAGLYLAQLIKELNK